MSASIYPRGRRPELEIPHNISFVLNISRLSGGRNGELELIAGHVIRKAAEVEIKAIKHVLDMFMPLDVSLTPWEGGREIPTRDGGRSHARLPAKQWRYFVIAFEGSNKTILEIEQALSILPQELKIGFTILKEVLPGAKAPTLIYQSGLCSRKAWLAFSLTAVI